MNAMLSDSYIQFLCKRVYVFLHRVYTFTCPYRRGESAIELAATTSIVLYFRLKLN